MVDISFVESFLKQALGTDDPELMQAGMNIAKFRHYKKGEHIVEVGEIVDRYYFLVSEGIIRGIYVTAQGKEITECVVSKRGSVAMPSAILDAPSPVTMEALTDVDMMMVLFEDVRRLEAQFPQVLQMENKVLTACWVEHWEMKRLRYECDAKERYLWFCREYPAAAEKMLLKHIASFLDVSAVSLSRIRRQLKEEQK